MSELIDRQMAITQLSHNKIGDDDCDVIIQRNIETIKQLPSAQPYTITPDGRLWITMDDIDKVTAVVVDEHKSKFCKQFYEDYEDAQPEIIRCKDCDWWTKQEDSLQGRCALLQIYPTGGWFCGSAERRKD